MRPNLKWITSKETSLSPIPLDAAGCANTFTIKISASAWNLHRTVEPNLNLLLLTVLFTFCLSTYAFLISTDWPKFLWIHKLGIPSINLTNWVISPFLYRMSNYLQISTKLLTTRVVLIEITVHIGYLAAVQLNPGFGLHDNEPSTWPVQLIKQRHKMHSYSINKFMELGLLTKMHCWFSSVYAKCGILSESSTSERFKITFCQCPLDRKQADRDQCIPLIW